MIHHLSIPRLILIGSGDEEYGAVIECLCVYIGQKSLNQIVSTLQENVSNL